MNETHPDKVKILFQQETGERKLNAFSWRYEEQPRAVQIGRVVVGKTRWCDVSGLAGQNVVASGSRISSQIRRKVPIRRRQLNGQENGQSEPHGWVSVDELMRGTSRSYLSLNDLLSSNNLIAIFKWLISHFLKKIDGSVITWYSKTKIIWTRVTITWLICALNFLLSSSPYTVASSNSFIPNNVLRLKSLSNFIVFNTLELTKF